MKMLFRPSSIHSFVSCPIPLSLSLLQRAAIMREGANGENPQAKTVPTERTTGREGGSRRKKQS